MRTRYGAVDDPAAIGNILSDAEALLLDFDGPVCSVFAGLPAPIVADQLREVLSEGGHFDLGPEINKTEDPFDVLRYAAMIGATEEHYVEAALRAHELEAVGSAEPTAGAHELMRRWVESGRALSIVSNNSTTAVEAYLDRHGLHPFVQAVCSRTSSNPELLKPNPYLVDEAVAQLGYRKERCVMIGDSVSDARASIAAGVCFLGFANKPGKESDLRSAGAAAILTSKGYPSYLIARLGN
jgi:phosphoglycolate phosphatase